MSPLVERIGWMLVHSVWEDLLLWAALQVALLALARKSPQARYLAACVALLGMAVLPWLTFDAADLSARLKETHTTTYGVAVVSPSTSDSDRALELASPENSAAWTPAAVLPTRPFSNLVSPFLPFLVAAWIAGLVLFSLRLWLQWRKVRTLIHQPILLPDPAWKQRFARLVHLSGVDRIVRLGESAAVGVPIVAGWLKPVILLPLGVATSLPVEQVEAILLHELAHISRHDYLVNLLQNVVETIFFYHPAVWAVSRRIRLERELACDDQTVEWCRNPRAYAEALASFEEFRHQSPLLAATGDGDLFARIRRILLKSEIERRGVPIFAIAGFCGIGLYLASMFLTPILAQRLMTASERVAKIQALQPPPGSRDGSYPSEDLFVTGTVTTEDGAPLPPSLFFAKGSQNFKSSEAQVAASSIGSSMRAGLWMDGIKSHTYYGNARTGKIQVGFWAEGYAPFRQSAFTEKSGNVNLNFVLNRGFPGQVRITGSNDEPLAGVLITATFPRPGEPLQLAMPPIQTDANGLATFGHVEADSEIHLVVSKEGWQMVDQVVSQWSEKEPLVWKLEPSKPTTGLVIDQATRQPITDATILLAARRKNGDPNYQAFGPGDGATVLGHTDSSGRFELKNLSQNDDWRIYVEAPGYTTTTFPIDYGATDKICELERGLQIRGEILDPKGIMSSKKLFHAPDVLCSYTIQATPFYGIGQNQRCPLDKLGPEMPFSFDNVPKGAVTLTFIYVPNLMFFRRDIELKKDVDDLVIDLSAYTPPGSDNASNLLPLRDVTVTVKTPGNVRAAGSLDGSYDTLNKGVTYQIPRTFSVVDGVAATKFPVPTTIHLNANQLIGFWFPPEDFAVPTGTGTFTHTVTAIPAGVIHGHVTLNPNLVNRKISIMVLPLKIPDDIKPEDFYGRIPGEISPDHDYVTPPLPFGGTYSVLVDAGPSYYMSAPAVVDAEHPLVVRDIEAAALPGKVTGRFIDAAGKPIANEEVWLAYFPTATQVAQVNATTTDNNGDFTIPNVNFSVPGFYGVHLTKDAGEPPTIHIDGHTPQFVLITEHPKKH